MAMTMIYLALGSNVGDSRQHIKQVADLLAAVLRDMKQAPVYLSKAVGYTDQPDFFNTAVSGLTELKPATLLEQIKDIEQQVGRTPTFLHGPREIDIDIIFYGDTVLETDELTIPHPGFRDRDFVLRPLLDLEPSLTDPQTGQTVASLLAKINSSQKSLIRQVDEEA
ncbi:MAG TPA: 2-amino-4-hydroxy-6-hydroxymethyldihydropteridine diphosphokinase [Candidatus Dormibacteraeota bacterium]|nr:2-amino-4-hydroxy-6-hydroxymethyldihydropteridine diphosphokinase [Candidatus Dormibacteraeota bacterium]